MRRTGNKGLNSAQIGLCCLVKPNRGSFTVSAGCCTECRSVIFHHSSTVTLKVLLERKGLEFIYMATYSQDTTCKNN